MNRVPLNKLVKMKLHDVVEIPADFGRITIIRVTGGWIYSHVVYGECDVQTQSDTFVPYIKEVLLGINK